MSPSRVPPQEPYKYPDTPEAFVERANQVVERYKLGVENLLASVEPSTATFQNLMLPLAHLENERLSEEWSLKFYQRVHPNEKLREASRKAAMIMDAQIRQPDVSDHAKAILAKGENLDAESQKFLESEAESYYDGPKVKRLEEINKRLELIQIQYEENLNVKENGKGIWLSEAELDGLPRDVIDDIEKGVFTNSVGLSQEKFFVKYTSSAYPKLLQYCVDPDTRKMIWIDAQKEDVSEINPQGFSLPLGALMLLGSQGNL